MTKKQVSYYVVALVVIIVFTYLYTSDVMAPKDESNTSANVFIPSDNSVSSTTSDFRTAEGELVSMEETVAAELPNSLSSTNWRWLRTEDTTGAILLEPRDKPFILRFGASDSMGSETDCNTIGGEFMVEGNSLTFDKLLSTKMYCENSLEESYTSQLLKVSDYLLTNNMLKLSSTDNSETMFFVRVEN